MIDPPIVFKRIIFTLGHVAVATIGVAFSTASLFFLLKPILSPFVARKGLDLNLLLRLPFFPLQAVLGFIVGYVWALKQNAFAQDRSARYVWIIPTIWFLLFFLSWSPASILIESRWDHFFWSNLPESKKIQLVTTLPLLTSMAYSLGSYVRIRRGAARI